MSNKVIETLEAELETKEKQLTEAKKAVTAIEVEVRELQHGILLFRTGGLNGNVQTPVEAPPGRGTKQDMGPVSGKISDGGRTVTIFKRVLMDMMERICEIPKGDWFPPGYLTSITKKHYPKLQMNSIGSIIRGYLAYMVKNHVVEGNKKRGRAAKYRRHPDLKVSDEEIKRKVEEQRRLMQEG